MKIMRVKQPDGTLVDIPIGVSTGSSAISSHNISTSAHADIREEIQLLSNEVGDVNAALDSIIAIQENLIGGGV